MQTILIKPEEFSQFISDTPWEVIWSESIPIADITPPKGYLFTTFSGTSHVHINKNEWEQVGGLSNFRFDINDKNIPVIKRYERGIDYKSGKYISIDLTSTLGKVEHHIYSRLNFDPFIWESIPLEWQKSIENLYNNPSDWLRAKSENPSSNKF